MKAATKFPPKKTLTKTPSQKQAASTSKLNTLSAPPSGGIFLQRKPQCACGGGCPLCQQEMETPIQAKLKIGAPNDKYEQEADCVAEKMMRMPDSKVMGMSKVSEKVQRKCAACESGPGLCPECAEEENIPRQPLASTITSLMQGPSEDLEEEEEELRQTKRKTYQSVEVPLEMAANINMLRGGGQPLPKPVRSFFEPRFGQDFSQVRLLTDDLAAKTAQAINAKAFTLGRDVVFGAGQYSTETAAGKRLLAHELTHVVQQGSSPTTTLQRSPTCTSGTLAVMWPRYITPDGPCFSFHVAHRGLEPTGALAQHPDSIRYQVSTDCPVCRVVGHVVDWGNPAPEGHRDPTAEKTLINGRERGRRRGEPNQL